MKIENPERFYLTAEQRRAIEKDIEFHKEEEKRMGIPCLYLLKRTNLENKLWWDDYLKSGCKGDDFGKTFQKTEEARCP